MNLIYSWDEVPLFIDPIYIARLLGLSESTIRRYIRNGELKAMKMERVYRIAKDDLIHFVDKYSM